MNRLKYPLAAVTAVLLGSAPAAAQDLVNGGKLLLTGGVSTIEGSGGGGLSSWATITGYETPEGIGANGYATVVRTEDYELRTAGVAVGLFDRLELSFARQDFDTGATGGKLGIGNGFTFRQDVTGVKLKLVGDAVYDQDRLLPQISIGAQHKSGDQAGLVRALGAKDHEGTDYYIAATKVLLDRSLVLSGAVRATKANQTGILGFGGDKNDGYTAQFEGSAGWLVSKRLVIGAEYRSKPNNLGFAKEDDWADLFAAYAVNKHLSITAAYVALGDIATFEKQRGLYLSLQAGF